MSDLGSSKSGSSFSSSSSYSTSSTAYPCNACLAGKYPTHWEANVGCFSGSLAYRNGMWSPLLPISDACDYQFHTYDVHGVLIINLHFSMGEGVSTGGSHTGFTLSVGVSTRAGAYLYESDSFPVDGEGFMNCNVGSVTLHSVGYSGPGVAEPEFNGSPIAMTAF